MTLFIEPLPSLTDAWVAAQDAVRQEPDARAVNLVLAITDPTVLAEPDVVAVVDRVLAAKGHQSVATVANTLFPQTLYRGPDYSWSPSLSAAEAKVLDDSAAQLYTRYGSMLSTLRSVPANKSGTYFSRMMAEP